MLGGTIAEKRLLTVVAVAVVDVVGVVGVVGVVDNALRRQKILIRKTARVVARALTGHIQRVVPRAQTYTASSKKQQLYTFSTTSLYQKTKKNIIIVIRYFGGFATAGIRMLNI